jgi:hypothetical protein
MGIRRQGLFLCNMLEGEEVILGIVGSEGAKFTAETEKLARDAIRGAITTYGATKVVSGACPKGGIDIWAVEEAKALGVETQEFPPGKHQWSGPDGFMARNIQIAEASDMVICFTVKTLPKNFKPGGWEFYCYHCDSTEHIKSGGCWTTKRARQLGKAGVTLVLGD